MDEKQFNESLDRYLTQSDEGVWVKEQTDHIEDEENPPRPKNWRITKTITFTLENMTEDEAVDTAADRMGEAVREFGDDFDLVEI